MGSLLCGDLEEELAEILDTEFDERLPTGAHSLMIGEPVASAKDLQRYRGMLLEKRRELSSVQDDAGTRVPAAGGLEGDLIDQANADEEAELLDTGNIDFEPPTGIGNRTWIVRVKVGQTPFPQTVNSSRRKIARAILRRQLHDHEKGGIFCFPQFC